MQKAIFGQIVRTLMARSQIFKNFLFFRNNENSLRDSSVAFEMPPNQGASPLIVDVQSRTSRNLQLFDRLQARLENNSRSRNRRHFRFATIRGNSSSFESPFKPLMSTLFTNLRIYSRSRGLFGPCGGHARARLEARSASTQLQPIGANLRRSSTPRRRLSRRTKGNGHVNALQTGPSTATPRGRRFATDDDDLEKRRGREL